MGGRGADRTAIPWNLARPPKPTLVGGPGPGVNSLTVAPDGRTVGTGGNDGTAAACFDIADRSAIRPLAEPLTGTGGALFAVAVSPDGHILATAGFDERIRPRDLREPTRPREARRTPVGAQAGIHGRVRARRAHPGQRRQR